MNSFEYLRSTCPGRGMPWVKRGMVVVVNGKRGVVTAGNGAGIRIRLDGKKFSRPYHPQWETVYYDDDGAIIKDYREKQGEA